jgi:hypothetical protein
MSRRSARSACSLPLRAANAVSHTASGRGGWFAVEVRWQGPVVRVVVADQGAPTGPWVSDDPAGEHGRGLLVVQGLSARSSVCGDQRGRLVWAEIPWTSDGEPDQRPPGGAPGSGGPPGRGSAAAAPRGGERVQALRSAMAAPAKHVPGDVCVWE